MLLALKLNNKSLAAETAPVVLWNEDQKRFVRLRQPGDFSLRYLYLRSKHVARENSLTALQEQREQRSWPEGRRAGCPE